MTKEGSILPSSISFKKLRQIVLHRRLRHAEGQAAIDRGAHRNLVEEAAIHADDRDGSEVAAAMDRLAQHMRPVRAHEGRDLDPIKHGVEAGRRCPARCRRHRCRRRRRGPWSAP